MPFYRFEQMAECLVVRVAPADTTLDRYVGLEHLDPETLKIRRWGTPGDVIGEKLHFWPGDIIFGKRRAYQRKLAVADFEGICSAHAMVLRARPAVVLPEFLPFFMQSDLFMNRALEISVGSLSPTINWRTLAEQEFPLPPLEEQRRIVKLLQAVEEAIHHLKSTYDQAKAWRTSLINDEMEKFSDFVELANVCIKIIDGPHYPPKFIDEGIPFILVSNLSSGVIDWNVSKWISPESYQEIYPRINSEPGDVLYTVVGSYGVPVFVDWDTPFGFQRHIALLKPDRNLLDGRFLQYYLESSLGKQQANLRAVGLAQKTITLGALKKYSFPKVDIERQRLIVGRIQSLERSIGILEQHIQNIYRVKKSIVRNLIG